MKPVTLFLLLYSLAVQAQENNRNETLQLFFGKSFHGTGDVLGIEYGGTYTSDLTQKSFWFAEVGGSIHEDAWPLFYSTPSGEWIDASIHYTTAGLQAVGGIGLRLLRKSKHEIGVRLGAIFRYQSSSYWDEAAVYYPPVTGLDFPVVSFVNTTPKKTMSLGGRGSFSYSYSLKSNLFLSATASLQTDSNGDTLSSTSIGIGKRF